MNYTDYANVIEKGSVLPSVKVILDTYARDAAVGKPVRFVTGATAGMEVRSTGSVMSSIIVDTREFIRNLTRWYVFTPFEVILSHGGCSMSSNPRLACIQTLSFLILVWSASE